MPSVDQVNHILSTLQEPITGEKLLSVTSKPVIQVQGKQITITLSIGYPLEPSARTLLASQVKDAVSQAYPEVSVSVTVDVQISKRQVQAGLKNLAGVKNIIAVASGKGGVGKSTTAVNLSLALQTAGARVGLLDADIYGPSMPTMLGLVDAKPESLDGKRLEPLMRFGLQTISIGNLIDEKAPVIWRGPMVSSVLQQLFADTRWQDLDYLIVDLPPGTGDIQLTLCQKIPLSGAVIVTTPQDIALADVKKAIAMFNKVNVNVLGVVENMSYYQCSHCGEIDHLFGQEGAKRLCEEFDVDLLGQIPLTKLVRECADNGKPITHVFPDDKVSLGYKELAHHVSVKLAQCAKNYTSLFPDIVVE